MNVETLSDGEIILSECNFLFIATLPCSKVHPLVDFLLSPFAIVVYASVELDQVY